MLISRQKSGSVLIKILLNCQFNHMPSILGEQMFTLALAPYVKALERDRWPCLHHRVLPGSLQTETCIKCLLLYSRFKIYGLDMLETMLIWLHLKMFIVGWWNLHSLHIKDVSALSMGKKKYGRSKFIRPSPQGKNAWQWNNGLKFISIFSFWVINRKMPLPINLITSVFAIDKHSGRSWCFLRHSFSSFHPLSPDDITYYHTLVLGILEL